MEYTKKNYKKAPLKAVHFWIFLALMLGQIACGYALGISGAGLAEAQNYITISNLWVGLIGAGSLIGLAGSAIMGKIADSFGRRGMLMLICTSSRSSPFSSSPPLTWPSFLSFVFVLV